MSKDCGVVTAFQQLLTADDDSTSLSRVISALQHLSLRFTSPWERHLNEHSVSLVRPSRS
jgi:hypothetical protein